MCAYTLSVLFSTPQTKWEQTSDAEKPAVIGILLGVIVAQVAIGATIDVVDRIPIVNKLLQLVSDGCERFACGARLASVSGVGLTAGMSARAA